MIMGEDVDIDVKDNEEDVIIGYEYLLDYDDNDDSGFGDDDEELRDVRRLFREERE